MSIASRNVAHVVSDCARPLRQPADCVLDPALRRGGREPHLTAADVMTAGEVAVLLGVPISTVHHWARERAIPSRKIGRRRLFVRHKIEAMLLSDDR
jgi:excisionase family DNA binding protein